MKKFVCVMLLLVIMLTAFPGELAAKGIPILRMQIANATAIDGVAQQQPPSARGATAKPVAKITQGDLLGAWEGYYYGPQGITALQLTITKGSSPGALEAAFAFFAHPNNPGVPNGLYKMRGSINASGGGFALYGSEWLIQPATYVFVDISGALNSDGTLSGSAMATAVSGSYTFSLSRTRYPEFPNHGREHYVVFREWYRSNRVEVSFFDAIGEDDVQYVVWDKHVELADHSRFANSTKYYLENGQWAFLRNGCLRISDYATAIIESDLDVRDKNGVLLLAGDRGIGGPIAATGITLSQTSLDLKVGQASILSASVLPANATDKSVTWSSDYPTVATVENGAVTAISPGWATITATTHNGIKATCLVIIEDVPVESLEISPATTEIAVGESRTFDVTFKPANATDKSITWSSSDPTVATIDFDVLTAVAPGQATITATAHNGVSANCTVTVKDIPVTSLTLSPAQITLASGKNRTLQVHVKPANATDKAIAWLSSNPSVATVQNGVVTAVTSGQATIVATAHNGVSASCAVTVKVIPVIRIALFPSSTKLDIGKSLTIQSRITPSNATDKTLVWTSTKPDIASVSEDGIVTAKAPGKATIKATAHNGKSSSLKVTVTEKEYRATYEGLDRKSRVSSFAYSDSYFAKSSYSMNKSLAKASAVLSATAYSAKSIKDVLSSMGYSVVKSSYPIATSKKNDTIGYTIALKNISYVVNDTTVIVVCVSGTRGYEWVSNFSVGTGENHSGFYAPVPALLRNILSAAEQVNTQNVKFWILGHSRGAAVSNIVASLVATPENSKHIFAYNFACPNVTRAAIGSASQYNGIHNFVYDGDFVTRVPMREQGWGFKRYGKTHTLKATDPIYNTTIKYFKQLTKKKFVGNSSWSVDVLISLMLDYSKNQAEYYRGVYSPAVFFNAIGHGLGGDSVGYLVAIQHFSLFPKAMNILAKMVNDEKLPPSKGISHAHTPEMYISWMNAL